MLNILMMKILQFTLKIIPIYKVNKSDIKYRNKMNKYFSIYRSILESSFLTGFGYGVGIRRNGTLGDTVTSGLTYGFLTATFNTLFPISFPVTVYFLYKGKLEIKIE